MIRIGTSGWHYDHWRGNFYPDKLPASAMFEYYRRFFDTVEINNSFYKLPTIAALEHWRDSAPNNFLFAIKASRYLTHMKKLKDPVTSLNNFLPLMAVLGDRLGPILFQLPPRWHCDLTRLAEFLEALPTDYRYCFELRDPSWFNPAVYQLMQRYNVACCIYELAGFQSPLEITADFTYIRLHGPSNNAYQGSYSLTALNNWSTRIQNWQKQLRDIYLYFDNDQAAYAVENARQLKELVYRAAA